VTQRPRQDGTPVDLFIGWLCGVVFHVLALCFGIIRGSGYNLFYPYIIMLHVLKTCRYRFVTGTVLGIWTTSISIPFILTLLHFGLSLTGKVYIYPILVFCTVFVLLFAFVLSSRNKPRPHGTVLQSLVGTLGVTAFPVLMLFTTFTRRAWYLSCILALTALHAIRIVLAIQLPDGIDPGLGPLARASGATLQIVCWIVALLPLHVMYDTENTQQTRKKSSMALTEQLLQDHYDNLTF